MRLAMILALAVAFAAAPGVAQTPAHPLPDTAYTPGAYRVFRGSGQPVTLDTVVAAMARAQVVFIGESHDDPTGHMLELELLRRAWETYGNAVQVPHPRDVVLSLEFFERDVQPVLDEYLAGIISEASFTRDARPWPRYATDYRPLVEFARERDLSVVAANAPRRYVSRVSAEGRAALDALGPAARAVLPPLPYGQPSDAYRDQWIATMSAVMAGEGMTCGAPDADAAAPAGAHGNMGNIFHSQVLWDASMAYWISRVLEEDPTALVLHMVGGFHVARGTGTPEQLEAYRPGTAAMVVMLRPVEDPDVLEPAPEGTWGDFVIQTERARTLEALACRGR